MKDHVEDRLSRASFEDKRWVLECLDTRVYIWPAKTDIHVAVGVPLPSSVSKQAR